MTSSAVMHLPPIPQSPLFTSSTITQVDRRIYFLFLLFIENTLYYLYIDQWHVLHLHFCFAATAHYFLDIDITNY
jgi:hypothetical protein